MIEFLKKLAKALWVFVSNTWNFIVNIFIALGPVTDSVRGVINERELYRVISTSLTVTGGFWSICQYLYNNAALYITDHSVILAIQAFVNIAKQNYLWATIFIVIFLGDFLRRKYAHGS